MHFLLGSFFSMTKLRNFSPHCFCNQCRSSLLSGLSSMSLCFAAKGQGKKELTEHYSPSRWRNNSTGATRMSLRRTCRDLQKVKGSACQRQNLYERRRASTCMTKAGVRFSWRAVDNLDAERQEARVGRRTNQEG